LKRKRDEAWHKIYHGERYQRREGTGANTHFVKRKWGGGMTRLKGIPSTKKIIPMKIK